MQAISGPAVLSATQGEALSRELRMAVNVSGVMWITQISTPPAKNKNKQTWPN